MKCAIMLLKVLMDMYAKFLEIMEFIDGNIVKKCRRGNTEIDRA